MSELETIQAEEVVATPVKEKKVYIVDVDGVEQTLSQAAYARHLFKQDMSRGDIAKELGVPYYIAYSATANMFNAAHPESGEGVATHRGEAVTITAVSRDFVADPAAYDGDEKLISVNRPDYMRELVKQNMSRGDVAKLLDCPYSTVYAATKEVANASGEKVGKIMVEDPRTGETLPRVDVIRSMYEENKDKEGIRREIANALHCDYAIVWAATKEKKAVPEDVEAVEAE